MEEKGANVSRKSEKRKAPRARREKIPNYRKWPRGPCRNSMNCVTYRNVIRTSPGGAYAHMRTHDGEIEVPTLEPSTHTHTHTHTHTLSSPRSRKGCLRKRGTRSRRCVHNNTQRHNNTDAESHSTNLIHRTEIRMSHAGCRGYIGRQEHPETQSNTRTYGTKKSSYVHA